MQGSTQQHNLLTQSSRYDALDCLRGIAACTVVICHATMLGLFQVEPTWAAVKWTPLRLLWAGHQAVILFFVLSGFSLFILLKSLESSPERTPRFWLARWLRLYPAYAASLLFASASYALLAMGHAWPSAGLYVPQAEVSAKQWWLHLTLVGEFNTGLINPPVWSIVHEMRISLLFPAIAWLVERLRYHAAVAGVMCSLAIAFCNWDHPQTYGNNSIAMSLFNTLHYCTFFIVGALLAKYRLLLISWIRAHRTQLLPTAPIVALTLYGYGFDETWTSGEIMLGDLLVGAGATGIMLLALAFPILNRFRVLHFLGKISYSLYLVHFTCFGIICVVFFEKLPNPVLWLMVVVLSLVVASIAWLLIEKPALKWSRAVRPRKPSSTELSPPTIADDSSPSV